MGAAADRLSRVSKRLQTLPEEIVSDGAQDVRAAAIRTMSADTGGDRRLSGLRNAKPQTVKVTQRQLGNMVEGHVMAGPPKQRAPWFWMEEGTKPGWRVSRSSPRRSWHPGTPAKRTWSRAVAPTLGKIESDIERKWRDALTGR